MSTNRSLMLICPIFFPTRSVGGVRWTALCRLLGDRGWRITVVSRFYGAAASRDEIDRVLGPHVDIRYVDHPADAQPEPQEAPQRAPGDTPPTRSRLKKTVRRLLFVPDSAGRFWNAAHARLVEEAGRASPDVVLVTMPPWGTLHAARRLSREIDVPFVTEYRDSFMIDTRYGPHGLRALRAGAFRRFDRVGQTSADLVLHQIPTEHRWSRLTYPETRDRMRVLTNGFPATMLEGGIDPILDERGRRSVRCVGAMGGAEMLQLARATRRLVEEGQDLALTLVGPPPESADEIRGVLGDRAEIVGRVRHETAIGYVLGADVLVNYIASHRRASFLLSTKMFEYVASGKPVIEINPSRSDRYFLRSLPGVLVASDPTDDDVAALLRRGLAGEGRPTEEAREWLIREHAWHAKAAQVSGWLEDVADRREPRP
ncbi:MAG: glycosyltransferase [Planctomycetota bacterium]